MAHDLTSQLQLLVGDRFTIARELGGGGMSRVFLAHESALGRDVVLKVLPPDIASIASVTRFEREIALTAGLQHPHILPVITAGGGGDIVYYVTPYVTGESLRQRLAGGTTFALDDALRIAAELLGAVAHAHARGIVHRDIKPSNVLISEGHAVLADFGIARALAGPVDHVIPSLTQEPSSPYVAPEGVGGASADIYAAGAVAFEIVCGVPPRNPVHVSEAAAIIRSRHPAIRSAGAHRLASVLARALAPNESRRFPSAATFAAALTDAGTSRAVVWRVAVSAATVVTVVGIMLVAQGNAPSEWPAGGTVPTVVERTAPIAPLPGETADAVGVRPALSLADSGAIAHREWRIDDATRLYAAHLVQHPDDPRANVAFAILASWRADSSRTEEVLAAAGRALRDSGSLAPRERALVAGAAALAERRFDDACRAFARAVAIAPDFAAWLGSAECRVNDDLVVADETGVRFRSSFSEAAAAYREAIRAAGARAPGFAYSRLVRSSFTSPGRVRRGRDSSGVAWLAFPERVGDSVTFRPFRPGPRRSDPDEQERIARALVAAREFLAPVLIAWTNAAPNDAEPHEALAELLELDGRIDAPRADGRTALGEIAEARRLTDDPANGPRRARIHVRLLLRQGRFAEAAAVADFALRSAAAEPSPIRSIPLTPLAALLGRADRATQLLERQSAVASRIFTGADGAVVDVPIALRRRAAGFAVRAALGICDDDVRAAPAELRDALNAILPAAHRGPAIDQALLEVPVGLALACTGMAAAAVIERPTTPIVGAARALALGRPDEAAARLQSLQQQRARGGAPETIEWAAMEAAVRLAVGDTTGAITQLRRAIDVLAVAPVTFLVGEGSAGAIGRVLATLADLSQSTGDAVAARRYASAVVDLWHGADPALAPTVARMRVIAGR